MSKKITDTRNRLIELMEYYNINQTELCNRSGLQKSALSNYLNGDREPRQNQISLIADAFNINPTWLMGYDVQMEMPEIKRESIESDISNADVFKAVQMFKSFMSAPPEVKATIELLLKATQSQLEIPHLKAEVPKSTPELPRLKKDKGK